MCFATLISLTQFNGFDTIGFGPCVQVRPAIDDLAAQLIEGRTHALVPPLGQLVPVTNQIEICVTEDVVSVLIEDVCHVSPVVSLLG